MKTRILTTSFILFWMTFLNVLCVSAQEVKEHRIERGETLETIAQKYNTTEDELKKLNPNAARLVYVGMILKVPVNKANLTPTVENTPTDYITNDSENIILSKIERKDVLENFCGYMFQSSFENEAYKYGGNIVMKGDFMIGKSGWGVEFSYGMGVLWKPKFELANNFLATLGPVYGTRMSSAVDLHVPVKLLCVYNTDDIVWGCRISPTLLIGKGHLKFVLGAYVDMMSETSFGFTVGFGCYV